MYEQNLNISSINKFHWIGFKGAPVTNVLLADYNSRGKGISLGGLVEHFRTGATKRMLFAVNPGYSVYIANQTSIGMGLRIGYQQISFEADKLDNVFDDGDQVLLNHRQRFNHLVIGAGFQLRSKKMHAGIGFADLFITDKYKYLDPDTANFFNKPRNLVANFDYRIKLGDSYYITPIAIAYLYKGRQSAVGGGAVFEVKDYFWTSLNVYNVGASSVSFGTNLSPRLRLVYSYEMNYSKKLPTAISSHEINLMYRVDQVFRKKS